MDVFEIEDLKRYIFCFLRKKAELVCSDCNKILIWDEKVNDFIKYENIDESSFNFIKNGNYCMNCHSKRFIYNLQNLEEIQIF